MTWPLVSVQECICFDEARGQSFRSENNFQADGLGRHADVLLQHLEAGAGSFTRLSVSQMAEDAQSAKEARTLQVHSAIHISGTSCCISNDL